MWCRFGVQDSVALAIALELRYRGLRSPHKLKLGVSGCARECAEARGKDVGVIATEHGWNLYVAGNGGQSPKHAVLLAGGVDDQTLVAYIDRYLMFYIRTADRLQRTAPWLESLEGGLEHLKAVVCDDSLGLAAELEEAMERHVAGYRDEWAAVLDDEEKLSRFVSFVNAPEVADPTIRFADYERRVPVLLDLPAAVRFVSYEPALGPVDWSEWIGARFTADPIGLAPKNPFRRAPSLAARPHVQERERQRPRLVAQKHEPREHGGADPNRELRVRTDEALDRAGDHQDRAKDEQDLVPSTLVCEHGHHCTSSTSRTSPVIALSTS